MKKIISLILILILILTACSKSVEEGALDALNEFENNILNTDKKFTLVIEDSKNSYLLKIDRKKEHYELKGIFKNKYVDIEIKNGKVTYNESKYSDKKILKKMNNYINNELDYVLNEYLYYVFRLKADIENNINEFNVTKVNSMYKFTNTYDDIYKIDKNGKQMQVIGTTTSFKDSLKF